MARLPTPFGDRNTWAGMLNAFIRVEHNADGSHSFGIGNLAAGGVVFVGAAGSKVDIANLFWDETNTRLGVGNGAPGQTLHVTGTFRATGAVTFNTALTPANGGTGFSSYTVGDLIYADGATSLAKLVAVADGNVLRSAGVATAPLWGKVRLSGATTDISGTLGAGSGGTGQSAYTIGDLLYASGATALSLLADIADGNVLRSGGVGVAPLYGKVRLSGATTDISGTLGVGSGGTGLASFTVGDIVYASGATTLAGLADIADGNVLRSGGVGVAPLYGKVRLSGGTTDITGTLGALSGGTGIDSSGSTGAPRVNAGTWDVQALTNGQLLIGSTGAVPAAATLTAGTNITITNAAGSITINATGGGASGAAPLELTPERATFPDTNFPALSKNTEGNWPHYSLDFDPVTAESAYWKFAIASGVTVVNAFFDIFYYATNTTVGTIGWRITTINRDSGETLYTAGVEHQITASTVSSATGIIIKQSTQLVTTGWAGGSILLIQVKRDVAADTFADDIRFFEAAITIV